MEVHKEEAIVLEIGTLPMDILKTCSALFQQTWS